MIVSVSTLRTCVALSAFLAAVLLLGLAAWPRSPSVNNPVAVEFTGLSGGGIHLNPIALSRRIALMDRIWKPIQVEMDVVHSGWHFVDSDYESEMMAERARLILESGD